MYAVSFIYLNLSPHYFPLFSFQVNFFSLQGKLPFSLLPPPITVFHGIYWFPHCPQVWPLVRIAVTVGNSIPILIFFTIWHVSGWQRSMRRPPQMIIQNGPPFIIVRLSPGGGLGGGVFQKWYDIYTPPSPQTSPDQGMLNIYFPSRYTPRQWRVRMPKWCARAWKLQYRTRARINKRARKEKYKKPLK